MASDPKVVNESTNRIGLDGNDKTFKVKLVEKGFSQKEGMNYEKPF
jgi:hypothetical protein